MKQIQFQLESFYTEENTISFFPHLKVSANQYINITCLLVFSIESV